MHVHYQRGGATKDVVIQAELLKTLIGARGFEPRTPTVSRWGERSLYLL
jgi:hypothetical protein